jgi:hypothetical protein|tara:strand:+ start:411 stop:659 length:249 start_codon:yes stop_codon:yes gene_type:complete
MKTFKELKEDIEVTDKTGKALNVAQQYIKTYKNTRRPTPEIIKTGIGKFILKGKDEDLVAKMLSDKSIGDLKNIDVKTKKVK